MFSSLNILGLILGISSSLLITLYVNHELNFDGFHKNGKNMYRVVMHQPGNQVVGSSSEWWVVSPAILKPTWEEELPEIDLATRVRTREWTFRNKGDFIDERVHVVDPEFFEIFSFPLKSGVENSALKNPFSIVLSKEMAIKYFGSDDAIGQTLELSNGKLLQITGVLEDIPANSHLQFDFLVDFETLQTITGRDIISSNWLNNPYKTYLTLNPSTDLEEFDEKLRKYDVDGFNGQKWSFHLQPLSDIHFNRQISGTGDKGTLFIFITVGIFILFIACFNYANLSIAHHGSRAKNTSMRKIIGASRIQLINQFLSESFVLTLASFALSILMVWLGLPFFNRFLDLDLHFESLWTFQVILISGALLILMILVSGAYPAIYLSGLKLVNGIKGEISKSTNSSKYFRRSIVAIQFSVSILMIIGSLTVSRQLKYVENKNLGFQKEHIIYLSVWKLLSSGSDNISLFKQELLQNANIIGASASSGVPSRIGWSNIANWEGKSGDENPFFYRVKVDHDYLDLYGIELHQGRNFSKLQSSIQREYILNQEAVARLGFQKPVGEKFGFNDELGNVVGVVKGFHFESLHKSIAPLGIELADNYSFEYLSVKLNSQDFKKTINEIEQVWQSIVPDVPMNYAFFDERLEQLYAKDIQLSQTLNFYALVALIISGLGIFGILSLSIKEKTKEIGIRKILGAPFINLLNLVTSDIFLILGLATIVGGSLGWFVANEWLNNFSYRFEMGLEIVALSSVIVLFMAILPVSYKLIKSVRSNPVEALKNE